MNRFFPRARLSSRRRRPPKQEPKRRARGARSPDAAGLPMLGRPCPELSARGWQSAVPRWYARSANWADRRSGRPRTRLSSHPSIPRFPNEPQPPPGAPLWKVSHALGPMGRANWVPMCKQPSSPSLSAGQHVDLDMEIDRTMTFALGDTVSWPCLP